MNIWKKKQKAKTLYSVLVVIYDFADSPEFSRHSQILHALYTRGRHNSISTITATQKFSALAPTIRVNATEPFIYRLRNMQDLETFIDEVSAVTDKKTLMAIYEMAISDPYSFLYVDLRAKTKNLMFMIRFDKRIEIDYINLLVLIVKTIKLIHLLLCHYHEGKSDGGN